MRHVRRADGFQCRITQARPVTVLEHGDQQANPFIHLGQFERALVLPKLDSVFGGPVFQIDSAVFLTLAKRAKNGGHALHAIGIFKLVTVMAVEANGPDAMAIARL